MEALKPLERRCLQRPMTGEDARPTLWRGRPRPRSGVLPFINQTESGRLLPLPH